MIILNETMHHAYSNSLGLILLHVGDSVNGCTTKTDRPTDCINTHKNTYLTDSLYTVRFRRLNTKSRTNFVVLSISSLELWCAATRISFTRIRFTAHDTILDFTR